MREWANREGIRTSQAVVTNRTKPVTTVTTAAQILTDEADANGGEARIFASRLGRRVLQHHAEVAAVHPEAASARIDEAVGAGRLLQMANVQHWEQKSQAGSGINLLVHGTAQVLIQGQSAAE